MNVRNSLAGYINNNTLLIKVKLSARTNMVVSYHLGK